MINHIFRNSKYLFWHQIQRKKLYYILRDELEFQMHEVCQSNSRVSHQLI